MALPLLPQVLDQATEFLSEVELQPGEDRAMLCMWPVDGVTMVSLMAIDEKGNMLRSVWGDPMELPKAIEILINNSGING